MRKLLFIIMFVLAAGIAAQAGNVTKQAAARKATAFLNLKSESQLQLLDCGYETMYLFAIQDGGVVVVSADNRVQPILAYSRLSGINPQRMPKNLKGWLDSYDKQIRAAMTAQSPVAEGTLTLFDATGRQLMQRSIHAQHTTLDVSSLPTGIYMVQFTSQRGTTVSRLAVR